MAAIAIAFVCAEYRESDLRSLTTPTSVGAMQAVHRLALVLALSPGTVSISSCSTAAVGKYETRGQ
jgi:hypothetical protein